MKKLFNQNLYVVLIHYPVKNKNGEIIASAVTPLDLHDISRAAKTFGVRAVYIVTPLNDQKMLVEQFISHWTKGFGRTYNPIRQQALSLIRLANSSDEVKTNIYNLSGIVPKIVATCARDYPGSITYTDFRNMLNDDNPFMLTFGTAWGLAEDFIAGADYVLQPIFGNTDYNHLSVRSAVSIMLDRLTG